MGAEWGRWPHATTHYNSIDLSDTSRGGASVYEDCHRTTLTLKVTQNSVSFPGMVVGVIASCARTGRTTLTRQAQNSVGLPDMVAGGMASCARAEAAHQQRLVSYSQDGAGLPGTVRGRKVDGAGTAESHQHMY